ncbi:MAG: hypothetical protein V4580_19885 [Bacteroidota bacterium]
MTTKLKVALNMSSQTPDGKVTLGQNIINSIVAAPTFFPTASLPLPLASATAAITSLHTAIIAAGSGAQGSASNMHEKERIVLSVFNVLRAYVEMQANNTLDPQTVIEAAGMTVNRGGGNSAVADLTVVPLGNGIMQVSVPRHTGEKAFIYYCSYDGGNTWTEFECSSLATVQLKNQTPASTLQFKYAPIAKTKGGYSQVKTAIVL